MSLRPARRSAGFTMIEVLVALAIIAIALGASLRAVGSLATNSTRLHERMLAGWSADNVLTTMRLERQWPEIGSSTTGCPQADLNLRCIVTVRATPNPLFRQVEVAVRRVNGNDTLARISTVIPNESRRSL
jgi:general secretion pathway protein I